jgi:DNA mismatch endonuclease (patch repair protein)
MFALSRRELMSRIRSRGNKRTEEVLAKLFREHGITGWRRHYPVAGTPDFVFLRPRVAIFVDGCFWHGCNLHFKMPSTRTNFWSAKIERNRVRDEQVSKALKRAGWRVIRIWEHELQRQHRARLLRKLAFLAHAATPC